MGDVVSILPFLRTCENCVWHEPGICRKPGGWRWDDKYNRCLDFKRKEVKK